MRINKYVASTGYCSRREADELIGSGQVSINGIKAELGSPVNDGDKVTIKGKMISTGVKKIYIILNKPAGITCTTDKRIEGNIIDFINHKERIFPVGRLDRDSEGLILLTNDGSIVNKILKGKHGHEKEYIVTVDKPVTAEFIKGMTDGIMMDGRMTRKCTMSKMSKNVFKIILTEGRNRQIRRMCAYFDYRVRDLKRVRIMNLKIGDLRVGEWRDLTPEELKELNRRTEEV